MFFDPSDNLFGQPLGVWLFVGLVWAAPFVIYRVWEWWAERRDARSGPPT